jgi:cell pole-organizing protein PopZ
MEEILASIRRYVSDDVAVDTQFSTNDYTVGHTADVIRLTEAVEHNHHQPSASRTEFASYTANYAPPQSPKEVPSFEEVDAMYDKTRQSYQNETAKPSAPQSNDSVISDTTYQATTSSFSKLADAVKSAKAPAPTPKPAPSADSHSTSSHHATLENVIADMVRPMIKQWIDQNLPPMVEKMISLEIEKITSELNKTLRG